MITVNVTYKSETTGLDIALSRSINKSDDLRMVIGEVLYGVEVQCRGFNTDEVFSKYESLLSSERVKNCKFTKKHTIVSETVGDGALLEVSLSPKKTAAKKMSTAA